MVTVSVAVGRVTVSPADLVTPPEVPEIVTESEVQPAVSTVKFPLVAPAGTVTPAGTVATAGLLLESVTTAPPADAVALRITVPLEGLPPVTLAGLRLTEARVVDAGSTVSTADLVTPP